MVNSMQEYMQKFLVIFTIILNLLLLTTLLIINYNNVTEVKACMHYLYECCEKSNCQKNCAALRNPLPHSEEECNNRCHGIGEYCCPSCADQCQVDSECGSGCRCLADSNGNYCYCPGGGSGGGGGGGGNDNEPPSCSITVPLNNPNGIFYDAKEYLNQTTGQLETQQPTTRQGKVNTDDPDNDDVTVESLTTDKNCVQLTLNGENFTLTPQGHLTGVSPVDLTSTRICTATLTATVTDGDDTATCYKPVPIYYYPTYLMETITQNGTMASKMQTQYMTPEILLISAVMQET